MVRLYQDGSYLEPFVLQDSLDGCVSAVVDELDLEDHAEGAIAHDFDALVVDVLLFFGLAINDTLGDDSLRVQISCASH